MNTKTRNALRLLFVFACCSLLFYGCKPYYEDDDLLFNNAEQNGDVKEEEEPSGDPCGSQKKWDWTKAESFDYAYMGGTLGKINISNPFLTNASSDANIANIIRSRDYLPEQGWVLLAKVFGCPDNYAQTRYPYFMLYNKYTGIVRLFVFNGSPVNHQQAVATIGWEVGSDKNALFASSEVYRSANEEYHAGKIKANSLVNYITNYYSDAWFVTEMPLNFDPGMAYKDNLALRFRMTNDVVEKQELGLDFKFDTRTITTNAEEKQSGLQKSYKFLEKGQKYLTSAPSSKQVDDHFDKMESLLHPNRYEGHKRLVTEGIKPYKEGKLASALKSVSGLATAISGPLGTGLGLFSSFLGKSNSGGTQAVSMLPTMSVGSGTIKGEISITTNATSFPLQLPGSNHNYQNGDVNIDGLPVYDKPLGVISLEKTPHLTAKREEYVRYEGGGTSIDYTTGDILDYYPGYPVYYYSNHGYYRISDQISIALNSHSQTEVVSIKARLMARHYSEYNLSDQTTKTVTEKIEEGEYALIEIDKSWFMYGTHLVDIEDIKDSEILLPKIDENSLFLQLMIVLKPTNLRADQTPIVHSMTYNLNKNKTGNGSNGKKDNVLILTKY